MPGDEHRYESELSIRISGVLELEVKKDFILHLFATQNFYVGWFCQALSTQQGRSPLVSNHRRNQR